MSYKTRDQYDPFECKEPQATSLDWWRHDGHWELGRRMVFDWVDLEWVLAWFGLWVSFWWCIGWIQNNDPLGFVNSGHTRFDMGLIWTVGFNSQSSRNCLWIELRALCMCSMCFVVWARCGYFWVVLEVISLILGFWLPLCDDWWR